MASLIVKDNNMRLVEGWATVELEDLDDEVVPIDEVKKAFISFMDRGGDVYLAHKNKKVGKVINWWMDEHEQTGKTGIKVLVKINSGYEIDDLAWEGIKNKELTGFSIGGESEKEQKMMKDENTGQEKSVNYLKNIQLGDLSVVDQPANAFADIVDFNEFAKSVVLRSVFERFGVDGKDVHKEKEVVEECDVCKAVKDDYTEELAIMLYGDGYENLTKVRKEQVNSIMDKFDEMVAVIGSVFNKSMKYEVQKPCPSGEMPHWDSFDACVSQMKSDEGYTEEQAKKVCGHIKQEAGKLFKEFLDDISELQKKDYPWEQCIKDQKERYGDEETAKKVCAHIKRESQGKSYKEPNVEEIKSVISELNKKLETNKEYVNARKEIDDIIDLCYKGVSEGEAKKSDAAKAKDDDEDSEENEQAPEQTGDEEVEANPPEGGDGEEEGKKRYITAEQAKLYEQRGIEVKRGLHGGHYIMEDDMHHDVHDGGDSHEPVTSIEVGQTLAHKDDGKTFQVVNAKPDEITLKDTENETTHSMSRNDVMEQYYEVGSGKEENKNK